MQYNYTQWLHKLQLETGSTPTHKNDDIQALFQRNFKGKSSAPKWRKTCCQSTIRNFHATTTIRFTTGTCKTKSESQDCTGEQVPFEKPWRSHSTAICTDWIAQHTRIATHYCGTHRFDTPVPMAQRVATHAKHNSTASTKNRKSHLEPSVPLHAQFETDSTAKRRRWQPSRKRANFSPQRTLCLPEKTQCFVQILTFKSHP